jgi:hypothetical protein
MVVKVKRTSCFDKTVWAQKISFPPRYYILAGAYLLHVCIKKGYKAPQTDMHIRCTKKWAGSSALALKLSM